MAFGYTFEAKFGSAGSGDGQFSGAWKIAVDDNYIYVADRGNYRIQIFDRTTFAFVGKFGTYGTGDSQFTDPRDVAVDANYIYVADYRASGEVKIFNKSTYAFVGKFTDGDAAYPAPYAIAIDNNYIYTYSKLNTINKYNITSPYTLVSSFPVGSGSGGRTLEVSTDKIYSGNGTTLYIYNKSTGALISSAITCVCATINNNYIYVTRLTHKVEIYDISTLAFVEDFGSPGSADGQFQIVDASFLAIYNGRIYVNDKGNNRIQVFSFVFLAPSFSTSCPKPVVCAANSSMVITWVDNSSDEDGFKLERKRDDEGSYTQIADVGAGVTTYTDTGLALEHDYSYRVKAYNSVGESTYSNIITFDRYVEKVVNLALSKIGDAPIFCVYGAEERAIATKEIYFILRRQMLRDFEWNFALKRSTLTLDGTVPEFELPYRFALPSDCMYVVKIDNHLKKWKIEDGYLLSDSNTIKILYVMNDECTLAYDSIFRDCLATRIAAEIALPLTGQKDLIKFLWMLYFEKIQEAKDMNSIEIGERSKDNTFPKRITGASLNNEN